MQPTLTLTACESKPVTLTGTMSSGAAANFSRTRRSCRSTSAPTVATAAAGIVVGLTAGSATITAQAGSASATVGVTVNAPTGRVSSGAPTDSSGPSSSRSAASETPSSSPSPSATGTKGVTQTPGTSAGSAPATTTTQAPGARGHDTAHDNDDNDERKWGRRFSEIGTCMECPVFYNAWNSLRRLLDRLLP